MIAIGDKITLNPKWKDIDNWAEKFRNNTMTVFAIEYMNYEKYYIVKENTLRWYHKHIIKIDNDWIKEEDFKI